MEEEGEFDCWDWNAYYDLLPAPSAPEAAADGPPMPPPPSSDGHLMMISADDGSWALDVQVLSTLGLGGDDIVPTAEDWIIHGLTDQHLSLLDDIGCSSSGTGGDVDSSDASADATTNQAQADPCWGMDCRTTPSWRWELVTRRRLPRPRGQTILSLPSWRRRRWPTWSAWRKSAATTKPRAESGPRRSTRSCSTASMGILRPIRLLFLNFPVPYILNVVSSSFI